MNTLKLLRLEAKLSQLDVAKALGYTTAQFISNWERGISNPPIYVVKKLSRIYKVDVNKLYDLLKDDEIKKIKLKYDRPRR